MTAIAQVATKESFHLAEGPVWDATRGRLLWVDILKGDILEGEVVDGGGHGSKIAVTCRRSLGEMVGAVTYAADGSLLVAAQERLVLFGPDGTRVDGPRVVPAGVDRRCNDGSTDPEGRFLVGTLTLSKGSRNESLVRLEEDGSLATLDDDLMLSNGLAWSADGTRMFNVDTLRQVIYLRDYDTATGAVGERRLHVRMDRGYPDGIAMDVQDHLWVAMWGEGEVRRYSPDGALVDRIAVPAPHTSSIAFAGRDLDLLVISTATSELTADQHEQFPLSGRLFTVRAPVPGIPVAPWRPTSAFGGT
ncbi:hypothetical protein CcI49_37395 [Frankia sp. CcI49]|uniref:SMP-30/gluconolactonase/LRE family protein n=1 Tax=unclassified Frankia TaxID=2632575 RepID=UPI0006CA533B|nr:MULTISPECIES: SMP-30/gluconolactonase/LRE family protein [unclassified Frankia]KPM50595.1 hypothetical protein ACG83_39310 [Frankia sp. R43]ONH50289.1 hypothetical protein CcI49_37395 [Frankia sp. CcI49]